MSSWRAFKVILTSFPHEFNDKLLDIKFQIQNSSNTESSVNVQLNVLEDIDDISLTYALGIEGNQANNYTVLLNRKVHFCKFLMQRTLDNTLRTIYEDILKRGTFIKMCPLKKGSYTLREYRIDEELLPQYVPEANFYVDMKLEKANGDMILKGRLHGKIDKSKGFNNLKMFSMG
ncbi:uncharacterized protein LOC111682452 [Lucilia cuprina]|uniref:uncharacterized protein LOC111682452 n=1 Tax=Lucilia cuprina TaxID=7375 RepID=UPI001F06665F|nr:uncharacterized protein LOC111682452 [Lucilia cuprina]